MHKYLKQPQSDSEFETEDIEVNSAKPVSQTDSGTTSGHNH